MNILFTTLTRLFNNSVAGGELYLLDLVKGFSKSQISPYLVFPDSANRDHLFIRQYDDYGDYKEFDCKDNNGIKSNFIEIIKEFKIDVVHFQHFQTLPLSLMEETKKLGKKLVITIHDYFLWCENFFLLSPLKGETPSFCFFEQDEVICAECLRRSEDVWESIYKRAWNSNVFSEDDIKRRRKYINHILGMADLIITPTEYIKDSFLRVYPNVNPDRFQVLEHGLVKSAHGHHMSFFKNPDKLKVAFLGGFKYEKGSSYFNELLRVFTNNKVEFYLIGNLEVSVEKSVSGNLTIIGQYRREELGNILKREGIDLVVLLSPWAETFSYTLSESIINGLPVIATDIGAFRERVSKHGVGFLVPYENPIPNISVLLNDIAETPRILEFFKRNCIKAAQSFKDIDTMIHEYIKLYKKIEGSGI